MKQFKGQFCIVLSKDDPAAWVFENKLHRELAELQQAGRATVHELAGDDHVLSHGEWRYQMAAWVAAWMLTW